MFQVKTTVRAKGACECRRNTARTSGRLRDWYRSLLLAVVGISVTGCSGGSGGGSDTGGASGDGRTLEFSLQILQAPTSGEYWAYSTDAVRIAGCTPDPSNDVPRFRPDCVAGEDGLDASYEGLAVSVKKVSATRHATPGAAVLLIDQSTNVVVNDPADARLFAAKYFLTLAGESARTVLAAFSSDDPVSGQFSLLPQKPVTVFPLENPQFTADGRSYFATVDQLGALEGGASPLFAAIDRTLDFA